MKQSYPFGGHPVHSHLDDSSVCLAIPGFGFHPPLEAKRLARSLKTGEYTTHDAGDSHFYPLFKHTDIGLNSASKRPSERVSEGGSASRRDHLSKGTKTNAEQKTTTYNEPYNPNDARLVTEIAIGTQDIKVKCMNRGGAFKQLGGGVRNKIKEWTKKSRTACELHIRKLPTGVVKAFLTLTYPESFPVDGKLVKRHLHNMKQWLKRRGISGVWFLEFQRRGAPHYHAFLSDFPMGGSESVAVAWDRIVGSGDPKHIAWHRGELSGRPCLEYMRKPHAASWYASKYAVKAEQKTVPECYQDVGRFWGHWGGMKPVWQYLFGHGYAVFCDAIHSIIDFRLKRGIAKPLTVDTRYSSTMRGAMEEGFDYWFPDWTPF